MYYVTDMYVEVFPVRRHIINVEVTLCVCRNSEKYVGYYYTSGDRSYN